MLFNPFEEKFNLPSAFIDLCYDLSGEQKVIQQMKVVAKKDIVITKPYLT